jgi:predicted ATPase
MINGGFHEKTLDYITSGTYSFPMIERGLEALNYFVANPEDVLDKGLSLYINSKENGRGKTTLAHYLVYSLLWHFSKTENYRPSRTYSFDNIHSMCEKESKGWEFETWKATVLVIDDLGTEFRAASWKKDSNTAMLHRIMHYRLDNRLVTIITSNYDPSALSSIYSSVLDSVLEIRPDGFIGGKVFRQIETGGAEDFRMSEENSEWPV